MAAMSDAQPSKLNLWMDFLATNQVDETSAAVAGTRRRDSLDIGGVWIRQPKELHMKRLLGLLLVMGMVGCGDGGSPKLSLMQVPRPCLMRHSDYRVTERYYVTETTQEDAGQIREMLRSVSPGTDRTRSQTKVEANGIILKSKP